MYFYHIQRYVDRTCSRELYAQHSKANFVFFKKSLQSNKFWKKNYAYFVSNSLRIMVFENPVAKTHTQAVIVNIFLSLFWPGDRDVSWIFGKSWVLETYIPVFFQRHVYGSHQSYLLICDISRFYIFLPAEWHSKRLGGSDHGMVTKAVHKTLQGGDRGQGARSPFLFTKVSKILKGWNLCMKLN